MIAVDTSALMAIALNEKEADACISALEAEDNSLISAGTGAEALIVAGGGQVGEEVAGRVRRTSHAATRQGRGALAHAG